MVSPVSVIGQFELTSVLCRQILKINAILQLQIICNLVVRIVFAVVLFRNRINRKQNAVFRITVIYRISACALIILITTADNQLLPVSIVFVKFQNIGVKRILNLNRLFRNTGKDNCIKICSLACPVDTFRTCFLHIRL